MAKTVGELIEELKEYDINCTLDVLVSWYDRNNYNSVHRDIWRKPEGIEISVCECDGIVTISNTWSKDCTDYD